MLICVHGMKCRLRKRGTKLIRVLGRNTQCWKKRQSWVAPPCPSPCSRAALRRSEPGWSLLADHALGSCSSSENKLQLLQSLWQCWQSLEGQAACSMQAVRSLVGCCAMRQQQCHLHLGHPAGFGVSALPSNTPYPQLSISPTSFWATTAQPLWFCVPWWQWCILPSEWLQSIIASVLPCLLEFSHSISFAIMLPSFLAV